MGWIGIHPHDRVDGGLRIPVKLASSPLAHVSQAVHRDRTCNDTETQHAQQAMPHSALHTMATTTPRPPRDATSARGAQPVGKAQTGRKEHGHANATSGAVSEQTAEPVRGAEGIITATQRSVKTASAL